MKKIDVTTTENLYGFIRGLYAFGNVIFSMLSGWLSNKASDTRPAMIIGKFITILAALAYLFVEVFQSFHVVLFIAFEFLLGTSSGICSVFRTHIAMASTEADRSKAFGITQLATASGFVVGPLLQVIFSQISYPGISLFAGTHFNLYTAPVVLAASTSIIGIILLFCCFDGRMKVKDTPTPIYTEDVALGTVDEDLFLETAPTKKTAKVINDDGKPKYDIIAVIVVIIVKLSTEIVILNLITICPPYAMTAFQWSSEDTIIFQSAIMGSIGILSISFALAYVFFKLGKRIKERTALSVALFLFLSFHIITYPWGFWSERIQYQHVKGTIAPANLSMALDPTLRALVAESQKPGSKIEIVGCNPAFEWCEKTPKVNIVVFNAALIIALGIGFPLIQINLDILYSKVLGPIKQGTLQGIYNATGQALNIVGPLAFS
uniref:Major facilitator superfamily (MFS) profile domain-containing protein n=1 Tax=Panagrolaimus davidi TaxID=227884 RepID=A0A914QLA6_9BILA